MSDHITTDTASLLGGRAQLGPLNDLRPTTEGGREGVGTGLSIIPSNTDTVALRPSAPNVFDVQSWT